MTLRRSLIIFSVGTLLAWGSWFVVFTTVPPSASGVVGEVFFLGSLFLALCGTLTILGTVGRARTRSGLPALYLSVSFRQGSLIALGVVTLMLLERTHWLQWWTMLLLAGVLFLMDLVLSGRRRSLSPS